MDWDRVGWAPRVRACRLRSRTSSALSSHLTTTSCALTSTAEPEGRGGEAAGAGAQATPFTPPVWPFSRRTSAPVLASHTRAVLSSDAVASSCRPAIETILFKKTRLPLAPGRRPVQSLWYSAPPAPVYARLRLRIGPTALAGAVWPTSRRAVWRGLS